MKNIVVQGLGFVGSAMSIALASKLKKNKPIYKVYGFDLNSDQGQKRINKLNAGFFPFETSDKNLVKQLKLAIKRRNFLCTSNKNIFKKADVVIVSINCDLTYSNKKNNVD